MKAFRKFFYNPKNLPDVEFVLLSLVGKAADAMAKNVNNTLTQNEFAIEIQK